MSAAAPNAAFSTPQVKNWRDLVEHVGKNTSLAFYNVQTADPTSRQIKLTTKFRLIENEAAYVELLFGIEVSQLFDKTPRLSQFYRFRAWESRRLALTYH